MTEALASEGRTNGRKTDVSAPRLDPRALAACDFVEIARDNIASHYPCIRSYLQSMGQYTMYFIRSMEGARRDYDGWDDGLVNFGYVECERVHPIALKAIDRENAKLEAFRLWHEWRLAPADSEPEGYWIGTPDGQWFDMHLGDDGEPTMP